MDENIKSCDASGMLEILQAYHESVCSGKRSANAASKAASFFSRPAVLKAVTSFLREETLPTQKISSAVVPLMKVGHMLLPKPNISFSSRSINSLMAHRIDDTIY